MKVSRFQSRTFPMIILGFKRAHHASTFQTIKDHLLFCRYGYANKMIYDLIPLSYVGGLNFIIGKVGTS